MSTEQASADRTWITSFNSELRYFTYSGTRGDPKFLAMPGGGHQIYMPLSLSLVGTMPEFKFEGVIRGGYVNAKQTTLGAQGSVSTATDTLLSATMTYLGIPGFQPFVSLNLNLPTGKATLLNYPFSPRLDPDFVDVPTYGEGFNKGVTIGTNLAFSTTMMMTLSAGFTSRGNYQTEGFFPAVPQTTTQTNPGNLATLSASFTYGDGPWAAQLATLLTRSGTIANNGFANVKPGLSFGVNGFVGYTFTEELSGKVTGSYVHNNRNQAFNFVANRLMTEALNSNGNVYRLGVEGTYKMGALSFGPTASILYRDKNSYNFTNFNFVPGKTRYSVGGQAAYELFPGTSINVRAEYIRSIENSSIIATGVPQVSRHGLLLAGGGTVSF